MQIIITMRDYYTLVQGPGVKKLTLHICENVEKQISHTVLLGGKLYNCFRNLFGTIYLNVYIPYSSVIPSVTDPEGMGTFMF